MNEFFTAPYLFSAAVAALLVFWVVAIARSSMELARLRR